MKNPAAEKRLTTPACPWAFAIGLIVLGFVLATAASAQRPVVTAEARVEQPVAAWPAYADCYASRRGRSLYALHCPPGRTYYVWPYSRRHTRRIDRTPLRAQALGLPMPYFWSEYHRGLVEGVRHADDMRRMQRRRARLAANYDTLMQAGLAAFRVGRYEDAAWHFSTAADVQQGDAASRLLAGQAWLAVGEYAEAAQHIRRGLELQPRVTGLPLDLRTEYAVEADFTRHVTALAAEARTQANDAKLWWLLGYQRFFSGQRGEARKSFRRAYALNPDDTLVAKFLPASDRKHRPRPSP